MIKTTYENQSGVEIDPSHPVRPSPDLIGLVAGSSDILDFGMTNATFRAAITAQMIERYLERKTVRRALPGVMFGPTALPKGQGQSIEFVVDGGDAHPAVETVLRELALELKRGRQFLGGVGIRFVAGSRATLAPNIKTPSCFIELPAIRTKETAKIYDACGKALAKAGIHFGCHWGQYLTGTKQSLRTYWSESQRRSWMNARKKLLPTERARRIFESPILGPAGLR